MRIQPTAKVIYSMSDPPATMYWWYGAALLVAAVRSRQRVAHVLMIGSCGWTIRDCFYQLSDMSVDWWGLEPSDQFRTGPAFKTPEDLRAAEPPIFDVVIVDAYELEVPVAQWQSVEEIKKAFDVKADAIFIIHGQVSLGKDKWRVER